MQSTALQSDHSLRIYGRLNCLDLLRFNYVLCNSFWELLADWEFWSGAVFHGDCDGIFDTVSVICENSMIWACERDAQRLNRSRLPGVVINHSGIYCICFSAYCAPLFQANKLASAVRSAGNIRIPEVHYREESNCAAKNACPRLMVTTDRAKSP